MYGMRSGEALEGLGARLGLNKKIILFLGQNEATLPSQCTLLILRATLGLWHMFDEH